MKLNSNSMYSKQNFTHLIFLDKELLSRNVRSAISENPKVKQLTNMLQEKNVNLLVSKKADSDIFEFSADSWRFPQRKVIFEGTLDNIKNIKPDVIYKESLPYIKKHSALKANIKLLLAALKIKKF